MSIRFPFSPFFYIDQIILFLSYIENTYNQLFISLYSNSILLAFSEANLPYFVYPNFCLV